jgi:glycosyltransferase involved in cell wall biosynthesis
VAVRVLQVVPALAARTGGVAESVVQSSRCFGELGVETTIAATDLGTPVAAKAVGALDGNGLPEGATELDIRLFRTQAPQRFAFSPALDRFLARETPRHDLVHIHSLFLFPQLSAYRNAVRARVPYVVTPHGILDPYHRGHGRARKLVTDFVYQRRLLARAAVLHVTTPAEGRLVAEVVPAVPRAVASIGINWDDFAPLPDGREFRDRYLGGHAGPVVMHIGRVSHKKAPDVLVRAFAVAARRHPDARLVFVGPDDEGREPELTALGRELGVADRIVFTGMLPGEPAKRGALAAADVWTLPSNAENFGIAVAEALAAARAVVVSPRVNIAPDIAAAGAGVVAEQDPERFGGAIAALLESADEREALGRRAREFSRRYDWRAVAPGLVAVYEEALARS